MKWWEVEKLIFSLARGKHTNAAIENSTESYWQGNKDSENPTALFDFGPGRYGLAKGIKFGARFNHPKWTCHDGGGGLLFSNCPPGARWLTVCLCLDNSKAEVGRVWVCLLKKWLLWRGSQSSYSSIDVSYLWCSLCCTCNCVCVCVCVCVGYMCEE